MKILRLFKKCIFKKVKQWLVSRLRRVPERDHHFTSWFLLSFLMATTFLAIIVAVSNPAGTTLFSHLLNMGKMIAINGILFVSWTFIVGALLSFLYLPVPRLFLASFGYLFTATVTILIIAQSGTLFSILIGMLYSLFALGIGFLFILLAHRNVRKQTKSALIMIPLILGAGYLFFNQWTIQQTEIPAIADHMEPMADENPGMKGKYHYNFFTYGSGSDLHREEFSQSVDHVTPTVDASDFVKKWGEKRKSFWGFNTSELPINGRVWLPEGEGTFPLILMVHGNHTMEYLSTSGYDYLGELLASRGFIAISVDQDFINYSSTYGSPNRNYELRTWMLLQHLVHIQTMNNTLDHDLYEKIDFQQVALVGHSRGGQAALMGADYQTFFPDDDRLKSLEDVNIKAVVAIAPTDKSIDSKRASIHNTSYLLLHGARDADVSSIRDRGFYQATSDPDDDGFKAAVYIADANHTHFNSDWGSMDLSFPRGIFLNQKQTLDPEDQQQVAKVYLSAFFESVFHNHSSYEKLFQDYRYGKDWLPNTTIVNQFKHASYSPIVTFKENEVDMIDVDGFINWEIKRPKDRNDQSRRLDALELEWDKNASYSIPVIGDDFITGEHLVLTMANASDDIENKYKPKIEVEIETIDDVSVQLPLDEYMPFPPVIATEFTHFGLFDDIFRDEKYENSWEPVFQSFEIPIETFEKENNQFKRENINKITLHFKPYPGKILIEEIGIW